MKDFIIKIKYRIHYILYDTFKKNKNEFYKCFLRDWGRDDVFGPWTKTKNDGNLRFYKSYYMISYKDDDVKPL